MKCSPQRAKGSRSTPAQRRQNIRYSRERLRRLLERNFPGGGWLVTLEYDPERFIPTYKIGGGDVRDWMRQVRRSAGIPHQYIRSIQFRDNSKRVAAHRLVFALDVPLSSFLELWTRGPASAKLADGATADELIAFLFPPEQSTPPCARAWSPSRGILRDRA